MIINADDSLYDGKFSHEDLEEIRDEQVVEFDELFPKALYDYLHSFEGIVSGKQHFCIKREAAQILLDGYKKNKLIFFILNI